MRHRIMPVLGVLALLAASTAHAQGPLRLLSGPAESSVVAIQTSEGLLPLHRTSAAVLNLRHVTAPGSDDQAVVWQESDDGVITSWYAASVDGITFPRVIPTSHDLQLRWGRFDPLTSAPGVTPHLDVTGSNQLWIVQFETQVLPGFRAAANALGARSLFPMHMHAEAMLMDAATAAQVQALDCVRFVGPYHAAYKLEEGLLRTQRTGSADAPALAVNIMPVLRDETMKAGLIASVENLGGRLVDLNPNGVFFSAALTHQQIAAVARLDLVQWIDVLTEKEVDMDIARQFHGADYVLNTAGYRGTGVRGEVMDSGTRVSHQEFQAHPVIQHGTVTSASHGTSTYGQVFASGVRADAAGMMPDGTGIASVYGTFQGGSRNAHTAQLVDPAGPYRAVFQTNSWGNARTRDYTSISADMDQLIYDHDLLITQSQSNAGNQDSRPQAWAKNVVAVGGVRHRGTLAEGDDAWASGGSIGPAADGRTKPDLASFYDSLTTTSSSSDTAYTTGFGGTSGATPIVAGSFGLFFEMWNDGIFNNPVSGITVFDNRPAHTTAKAMMVSNATQWQWTGPADDPNRDHQGYGRPDLRKMYDQRNSVFALDANDPVTPLGANVYTFSVPANTPEFVATLVWPELPGAPGTSPVIVNNLDLRVTSPTGAVYFGNSGLRQGMFSTAGGTPDAINTLEKVHVPNPAAGTWTVEVIGSNIVSDNYPQTGALDAIFSLAITGVVQGPPPPPPFSLVFQTTPGLGDLDLELQSLPMTATRGYTLFSQDTSTPPGAGNVFGIQADLLTITGLTTPTAAGNPFNFFTGVPGLYPDAALNLPAGSVNFSGQMDGVAIVLDAAGNLVGQTRVVRVNW